MKDISYLSNKIFEMQMKNYRSTLGLYDLEKENKSIKDIGYTLNFLFSAVSIRKEELFTNYMSWFGELMKDIPVPLADFNSNFEAMKLVISEENLQDEKILLDFLNKGIIAFNIAYKEEKNILEKESFQHIEFLNYLLSFDRVKAMKYIQDKIDSGEEIRNIYLNIFQPTLYKIGEMWQNQEISVAKEHYCTAVIQSLIALLYPKIFGTHRNGHSMIGVSCGNELHEIGIRMVADFFEMDGWDTLYLGSNLPVEEIIKQIDNKKPDLLVVSATISTNVLYVEELIKKIRNSAHKDLKILVGGRAFNDTVDLWKHIGADGFGEDATKAVIAGNKLLEG